MARKSGIVNDRREWLNALKKGDEVALFENGKFVRLVTVSRSQNHFKFMHGGRPISMSAATGILTPLSLEPITPDLRVADERRHAEFARQYAVVALRSDVESCRKRLDEAKSKFDASFQTNPTYAVENYADDLVIAQNVYAVLRTIGEYLAVDHPFAELVSYITAEHARIIRDLTKAYTWTPTSTSMMSNVVKTLKATTLVEIADILTGFLSAARRGAVVTD